MRTMTVMTTALSGVRVGERRRVGMGGEDDEPDGDGDDRV
jgi:hypothetical protein